MTPQGSDPRNGWYPDPGGSGQLRYFDGTHWTPAYTNPPPRPSWGARLRLIWRNYVWRWVIAVVIAAVVYFVAGLLPTNDRATFVHHIADSGGPSGSKNPDITFAINDAQMVCGDLRGGASGVAEVSKLIDIDKWYRFGRWSRHTSEIIVYWAIADFCPEQAATRQDQWRTGD